MHRRQYLTTLGTVGVVALAGCQHNSGDNGVRADTTIEGTQKFEIEAVAGDTITVDVDNKGSDRTQVAFTDPITREQELDQVETTRTLEYDIEEAATYDIQVSGQEADVRITVRAST